MRQHILRGGFLVGFLLLMIALGSVAWQATSGTAEADSPNYDAVKTLIDQYKVDDSVKLNANDKLNIPTDPTEGVAYQLGSVEIDVSTGAVTTRNEGFARFYMPVKSTHEDKSVVGDNELAVYAGDSYDIALDASSEGFSTYIVVRDSSAPTDYEFSFDLSGGVKLSEDGNGGIEVLNEANRVVGIVAPPWAVDSNGMTVETTFKLRDGILVQTVAHQGAAYPVVADPSFSVGWAIYARWYDLADDPEETIEDAEDLLELIAAANCAGAPIAGTVLAGLFGTVVGSIHCAMVTLSVGESLDALEDIEDALPQTASDIPADCTLMIRLMYIGISPTRVELEDCGAYSGVYWRL